MGGALAGLLPAAGTCAQSRVFKPLLCLGGKTMIERTTDMLRSAGASRIVVVTGCRGEALKRHLDAPDVGFVRNGQYESTRMFDSVLLGLKELADFDRILVTPADVPLVRRTTLEKLADTRLDAAVPVYKNRRGHPVALGKNVIPAICAYNGGEGLRGALRLVGAVEIPVDDEGVAVDSDAPEDYYRLLQNFSSTGENGRHVAGLSLECSITCGESVFGDACARFMELIDLTESMRTACACLNISYTTGWRMINQAERRLGVRLLDRTAGGASGGGSLLTPEGARLLSAYQRFGSELRSFAERKFSEYFSGLTLP